MRRELPSNIASAVGAMYILDNVVETLETVHVESDKDKQKLSQIRSELIEIRNRALSDADKGFNEELRGDK